MDRESLLDMTRRLLALSSSPNEHEAAAALAKAQQLLTEHDLTVEEILIRFFFVKATWRRDRLARQTSLLLSAPARGPTMLEVRRRGTSPRPFPDPGGATMFQRNQEGSAGRTSKSCQWSVAGCQSVSASTRLSDAAARFLAAQENQAGNRLRTLQEYQTALWYVIEFAGRDAAVGELPADFARQWIQWLRMTPAATRRAWTRPKTISPETVSAFFAWPPPRGQPSATPRREQTIGRFWRMGRPFLAGLGLEVALPKRPRGGRGLGGRDYAPRLTLPPPLVPTRSQIAAWWQAMLDPGQGTARASLRRRAVLMQAWVLLTGMRIGEALAARQDLVEEHWLLLHPEAVKTGRPRLVYLTRQALAIGEALNRWSGDGQALMFGLGRSQRCAGWSQSRSWWQKQVRRCLPAADGGTRGRGDAETEKRHQGLRKACSTWLGLRDPVCEAAQLGHGGGDVVSAHYTDVLRRLPRRMDRRPMRLPELAGFAWPAPIDAAQQVPARLYEEFRRMVEE